MKKWYKYFIDYTSNQNRKEEIATTYEEFKLISSDFYTDNVFNSKAEFFSKYYKTISKFQYYNDFLKGAGLDIDKKILSVACGYCAYELMLLEKGYNITCSDLGEFPLTQKYQKLFPNFKYISFDILNQAIDFKKKYDVILCLGFVYYVNPNQLEIMLKNFSSLLNINGVLYLDNPLSENMLINRLFHNELLKLEQNIIRLRYFFKCRFLPGLRTIHYGYLKRDKEILDMAQKYGFILNDLKGYDQWGQFRRSYYLRKLEMLMSPNVKNYFNKYLNPSIFSQFRLFKLIKST